MVAALFLNSPGGGWLESVLTFDPHPLLFLTAMGPSSTLEILDRPLMSFCGAPAGERSKVSALTSLGVLFARVQTELASFKFSNHRDPSPPSLSTALPRLALVRFAFTADR
jgi:hypothetical protein